MSVEVRVGIDDADSPYGMCTTLLGARLAFELAELGAEFLDFPHLIRLNPNVPFKTRGNGAVALHVRVREDLVGEVEELVERLLSEYAHRHGKTDPTAAIVVGGGGEALRGLYRRALVELVPSRTALGVLRGLGARLIGGDKGRGVVGAAASIGALGAEPFSYELLLYRRLEDTASARGVEGDVVELDRLLRPLIFASVDYSSRRVIAVPHGPDPVIAGLRSFNPLLLSSIAPRLAQRWRAQCAVIFKTNQGTGAHLTPLKRATDLRPYDSASVRGAVKGPPTVLPGGHVRFTVEGEGGALACMVYRQTGFLARVARSLSEGDEVEVGGGVQPRARGLTLNVEYIRVIRPAEVLRLENPLCPRCGRRMKSAGRGKGFKCVGCGFRAASLTKVLSRTPRHVEPGLYLPSPLAYRHLSLPREALGSTPISAPPSPSLFLWPAPTAGGRR